MRMLYRVFWTLDWACGNGPAPSPDTTSNTPDFRFPIRISVFRCSPLIPYSPLPIPRLPIPHSTLLFP